MKDYQQSTMVRETRRDVLMPVNEQPLKAWSFRKGKRLIGDRLFEFGMRLMQKGLGDNIRRLP